MKILVTGGAGFIGSHLTERLLLEGHTVKVMDDLSNANLNYIRGLFNNRNFKFIHGDIRDANLVRLAASDVDIVFHLAAQIHVDKSIINPKDTFDRNVNGTINVLQMMLENDNIKKIILASSSEVYGSALSVPMNENHPLNPGSPYAASKAAADRLCFSYYNTYGLDISIMRSFNTYGPRQANTGYGGAIAIFTRRVLADKPPIIYGDGSQSRDYMYIDDAITAYMLMLNSKNTAGKVFNFGTGKDISVLNLANKIIEICGKDLKSVHVEPRPGEVKQLCADISLARKELGFQPQYSIENGLRKYIDWYRNYKYEEWLF